MNMRSADITSKGAAAISLSFMTKALSSTLKVLRVKTTILGLFLLATFWVAIAYHTKSQLLLSRNAAIQNNSNLALAFGEYVAQSVGAIDSALLLSRKVMATQRSVHISEIFESASNGADHIIQLALTDRDGILVQTNLGPVEREVNLSDRPHIRFHKETAADVLYVSEPVMGRVSNRWTIQFSRRAHPDEPENSGVLVASLSPDYFARFFSRFDLGEANVILMNGNGTILAQERRTGGDYTGQIHAAKEEIIKAATTGTCFSRTSTVDGRFKLYCAQPVAGAPQYVAVSVPEDYIAANSGGRDFCIVALLVTFICLMLIYAGAVKECGLKRARAFAEQASRRTDEAARELRYTLENMRDGIMLIDLDGRIRVYNDAAFSLIGLPVPAKDESVSNDQVRKRLLENPGDLRFPELYTLHSAFRLGVEGIKHSAGMDGRIVKVWTKRISDGYVRNIEDVTQPFLAEKARARARANEQAASEARAAFVARMSHEIRTPMHAALGFSRLLKQEDMGSHAMMLATEIYDSTSHLIELIDDVLDFSSIEAGRMRLTVGTINIRAMLDSVASTGKILLGHKPVALTVRVDPTVPSFLSGDERRLRQVLTNLVSNAIKFTETGEIKIIVANQPECPGISIEVSDTGRGIACDELKDIFNPWARALSAFDKPGAGLGLTITREIVEAMHGRIKVTSKLGAGTRFHIGLPLQCAEMRTPAVTSPAAAATGLRILVADDTRSSLMLIVLMLQARGHTVVTAKNGREAVAASAEETFDLILLDIQMPVMDGLVAAEIIITNAKRIGQRPLVSALTAQVMPENVAAARRAGMDHVLKKPFEDSDLDSLLARAARRKDEMRPEPMVV